MSIISSKKLYASSILIAPNPISCQYQEGVEAEACGAQTYFSVPLTYITWSLCPKHLFPQMRKGQTERLWHWLGDVIYATSLDFARALFADERRTWRELTEQERAELPISASVRSLVENSLDPVTPLDQVPLCDLVNLLAIANARAAVCAMEGEAWLDAHQKEGTDHV